MSLTNLHFKQQTKISAMALKHLVKIQGLKCSIYFPQDSTTIYNDASQDYRYSDTSDEDGIYLITGIYDQGPLTSIESEFINSFTDTEAFLYCFGDNINFPRNSKVEIHFNNSIKTMRIQDTKIQEGIDNKPIYGIHQLVPYI